MTVFCGPSGSGKSSLAMHTIYAEGQRRYVESLSSYARQFIGSVQKPKAERIEGLSPAIALEQKNLGHSPRSTVGTVTEIYDYLRILMARLGVMHCPRCQTPVGTQTPDQIVEKVMALPEGTRVLLLAPIDFEASDDPADRWKNLRAGGYQRVRIDGKTYAIDNVPTWDARVKHRVQIVVDRGVINESERSRVNDSIEQALSLSSGILEVAIADEEREEPHWTEVRHSQHLVCGNCSRSFQPLTPHHFSFNSAVGWCPQCDGLGTQTGTNPAALLTSPSATLLEGASLLWPSVDQAVSVWMLRALSRQMGVPLTTPIEEMTVSQRRTLYHGCGEQWIEVRKADTLDKPSSAAKHEDILFRYQFKGFYPALEEAAKLTPSLRGKLEMFTDEIACSSCDGARLRDDAAAVRFRGMTIGDLVQMPLGKTFEIVSDWKLDTRERKIAGELVREIESRIRFLLDVGLEYLTIARGAATLSGGESQRIRLAAQLGSGLCGVLYVLDEPTIGLHPRDNDRLIGAMHRLRDLGNTLLVVEHDRDVIANSDYLCDFGPEAGRGGGRIVAQGPPKDIQPYDQSVTAGFIDNSKSIPITFPRREVIDEPVVKRGIPTDGTKWLTIHGARENNLRSIDVRFPIGVFTAITGPSGSGKSSLINSILYPALARKLHRAKVRPGRHVKIEGTRFIDKIIRVDQSPLGNTPSSNPATYTGVFDHIRNLFAKIPEAAERGFTARTFSFNVTGGRCDACEGTGKRKIEMHFLPDVWVECEDCKGKRYSDDVLEIKYYGHSISDILDMPINDAVSLFADHPKITHILQTICDVGLGYVTLGQSAPTLSGGEAQRIKLSAELARPDTGRTLYLLDEPTTGLHFNDIQRLLKVIQRLVELGNTVIVIEHNLDVIKCADWVIDIGPEAGSRGGTVVIEGTPEEVAEYAISAKKNAMSKKPIAEPMPRSYTGEYLAETLAISASEQLFVEEAPVLRFESHASVSQPRTQQAAVPMAALVATSPSKLMVAEEAGASWDDVQPWKVLGRKWHSLSKGFPDNKLPRWPLELADLALSLLEQVAGKDSLVFEAPNRVAVRSPLSGENWAEVETKEIDSLRLTVAGPVDAIDLGMLQKLGVDGPVDLENLERTTVTLNLNDLKQIRSRNLKSFLKTHWDRSGN
jgi:excinuclease ABC subunit A